MSDWIARYWHSVSVCRLIPPMLTSPTISRKPSTPQQMAQFGRVTVSTMNSGWFIMVLVTAHCSATFFSAE